MHDAEGIAQVHIASWRHTYRGHFPEAYLDSLSAADRAERWREILAQPAPQACFVAEEDGRIVGFSDIGASRDDDADLGTGELRTLYLEPEQLGRGTGRALMERAVQALRSAAFGSATLWVLEANARARGFYAAAGWSPDGATHRFEVGGANVPELRYRREL